MRFHLKQRLIQKHGVIREGVPRPGKQNPLNDIYVAPQISTRGCGGVDPSHELRAHLPSPFHLATADTFVDLKDLFRLQSRDGRPVRTVVTTGVPGIGLSVSVGKFCLDWAQYFANKVRVKGFITNLNEQSAHDLLSYRCVKSAVVTEYNRVPPLEIRNIPLLVFLFLRKLTTPKLERYWWQISGTTGNMRNL